MTGVAGRISRVVSVFIGLMFCVGPVTLTAHHSFNVYDFTTEIPFEGVVATIRFRNPHIEMTLTHVTADGETVTIQFVEGAPANMLVRRGLRPEMVQPGTRLTAIGSPRIDDPDAYFLRRIRLPDGREFE